PVNAVVLIQNQAPVAFAHYIFHPTTISVSPACYLQDLFVDPAFCRRGMGRALIESVTRHARSMGCHDVYWQTHKSNAPAIKLYESMATLSEFQLYRRLACQPQSR
ncbi:MAG: GNAT family N-acetyltransferase, partial [Brevundimonas sp.]|nr:GNAT family N-acetyltransferase [Brevundimonas sp.]